MDEKQKEKEKKDLIFLAPYLERAIYEFCSDKLELLDKEGRLDENKIEEIPDTLDRQNRRPDFILRGEKYHYVLELKGYDAGGIKSGNAEENEEFISEFFGKDSLEKRSDLELQLDIPDSGSKVYIKIFPHAMYDGINLKKLKKDKRFRKVVRRKIGELEENKKIHQKIKELGEKEIPIECGTTNKVYFDNEKNKRKNYKKNDEEILYQISEDGSGGYEILPLKGFSRWDEVSQKFKQKFKKFIEEAEEKFDHKEYEQHKKILAIILYLFPFSLDDKKIKFFDSLLELEYVEDNKKDKIEYKKWDKDDFGSRINFLLFFK